MSRAKRVTDPITKEKFFVADDAGYGSEVRANLVIDPVTREKFHAPLDTLDENGQARGRRVVDPITKIPYFSAPKAGPTIPEGYEKIWESITGPVLAGAQTGNGDEHRTSFIETTPGTGTYELYISLTGVDLNNDYVFGNGSSTSYIEGVELFVVANNGLTAQLVPTSDYVEAYTSVYGDNSQAVDFVSIYLYSADEPIPKAWFEQWEAIAAGLQDGSIESIEIYGKETEITAY